MPETSLQRARHGCSLVTHNMHARVVLFGPSQAESVGFVGLKQLRAESPSSARIIMEAANGRFEASMLMRELFEVIGWTSICSRSLAAWKRAREWGVKCDLAVWTMSESPLYLSPWLYYSNRFRMDWVNRRRTGPDVASELQTVSQRQSNSKHHQKLTNFPDRPYSKSASPTVQWPQTSLPPIPQPRAHRLRCQGCI